MLDFGEFLKPYGMTEEQYAAALSDIAAKVIDGADMDWQRIVDRNSLPLNKESLRRSCSCAPFGSAFVAEFLKQSSEQGASQDAEDAKRKYGSTTSINKDGTYTSDRLIAISESDLKNPTTLLEAHGFDPSSWELVSAKNNIWNVYSVADKIQELYSSKITVKPLAEWMSLEKVEEWFDRLQRSYVSPPTMGPASAKYGKGDNLLLIDIADLHMNLQATMLSTGNEYNCDIAEKIFFDVIDDVVSSVFLYDIKKVIFCIGGDMLNADNLAGTTTKGTPQDNDTSLFDAYERICGMTVKAVDMLRRIAPVHVVYVPGNHDLSTGFKLSLFVNAWFRDCADVTVDYSPFPRKYVVFGKTLMVFAHDGNVKELPALIADEARQWWSDIEMTEVFLQHMHDEKVLLENNNMRIQRLPSVSAKSRWSAEKGFNSKRQCKSFLFDKDKGLRLVLYTPIQEEKEK